MKRKKLLIVDDKQGVRALLKIALEQYEIKEANNGEIAIEIIEAWSPDLVILDMKMPVLNGARTLGRLKERKLEPKVLLMTAYNEEEIKLTVDDYKLSGTINKPFDIDVLIKKVEEILF